MSWIKNVLILICGALFLMSTQCAQTKVMHQHIPAPIIKISNVYIQKQVPGEQLQKPYVEFGFEITGITNAITLDSVFCEVGKALNIKTDGEKRLKLLVEAQTIDNLNFDKAVFYYTQQGIQNNYVLNIIKKKETIFLP